MLEKNLVGYKLVLQVDIKQLIGIFALFAILLIGLLWLIMHGLMAHQVRELTAINRYIDSMDGKDRNSRGCCGEPSVSPGKKCL